MQAHLNAQDRLSKIFTSELIWETLSITAGNYFLTWNFQILVSKFSSTWHFITLHHQTWLPGFSFNLKVDQQFHAHTHTKKKSLLLHLFFNLNIIWKNFQIFIESKHFQWRAPNGRNPTKRMLYFWHWNNSCFIS